MLVVFFQRKVSDCHCGGVADTTVKEATDALDLRY